MPHAYGQVTTWPKVHCLEAYLSMSVGGDRPECHEAKATLNAPERLVNDPMARVPNYPNTREGSGVISSADSAQQIGTVPTPTLRKGGKQGRTLTIEPWTIVRASKCRGNVIEILEL